MKKTPATNKRIYIRAAGHAVPTNQKAQRGGKAGKYVAAGAGLCICLLVLAALATYISKLNRVHFEESAAGGVDTTLHIPAEEAPREGLGKAGKIRYAKGKLFRDKNIVNILLIGTDERDENFSEDARADAIVLVSLNTKKDAVKLASFQRGTGVPIPGRPDDWLTHTFAYGGASLTLETVEKCFLIEIEGYVRVNMTAFATIINCIGGVEITLSEQEAKALNNEVYTNAVAHTRVHPGKNYLDGYDALQYARLRYIDDDWVRIQRQRTVLKSVFNGTKSLNLWQLNQLADEILPLLQTNLSRWQITTLLFTFPQFMGGDVQDMSLPGEGTFYGALGEEGRVLNITDFEANSKLLIEFISA